MLFRSATSTREAWLAEVKLALEAERSGRGDTSRLIDLSPAITPEIKTWPGDTPFAREVLCDLKQGSNITLSTIRTTVHLGSHADGPNHYGVDAPGVGEQPLDRYIGICRVVHATVGKGARVTPKDLIGGVEQIEEPRVLIRTGTFHDVNAWNEDFAEIGRAHV